MRLLPASHNCTACRETLSGSPSWTCVSPASLRRAVIRSQPEYNSTDYGPGSALWTKGSAAAELLTADEKSLVSNLVTLAGAGVGYAAGGGDVSLAAVGANTARVEVENNSMAGDKGRESLKESKEWWKAQVRDKMGEGPLSATTNAIINALADTGDVALGSADYAADGAMALTACAIGDSYCNKALSDLDGKHQGVADTIRNLMKTETWSAIGEMANQALEGNQLAAENFGALAASVLLPGKKVPVQQIELKRFSKLKKVGKMHAIRH
ncbi:VENN motif pre-toxin domain-containing protein [uncultured Leclercia sp.]|uniref:VENN motif pre-toxin domain-containing protein n=1 Tax=uncultured Leclercia sp. TaxID=332959 RepID=UPI0025980338|nr:VENN motif pre-toxin domain-containing protein [uncultured Leclercia sp.]